MLNLLFISDSPKAVYLKNFLQPMLKVIIDVVTDFDQGLKDVFEKRPNTVCIQEQIGGVTGESVASHIRMLLGSGAPTFILMHEGNSKAHIIRGLFDYLIDLNQPNELLAEEIQKTLKEQLGSLWYKIYIPPAQTAVDSVTLPHAISLAGLEDSDDLFDTLLDDVKSPEAAKGKAVAVPRDISEPSSGQPSAKEFADLVPTAPPSPATSSASSASPGERSAATVVPLQSAPASPAEFRIRHDSPPEEEPIPNDLLLAFEQNYRPPSLFLKRSTILIMLAVVACSAAGWYAVRHYPHLTDSLKERNKPTVGQRIEIVPVKPAAPTLQNAPSQAQPSVVPTPVQVEAIKPILKPQLPKFVHQAGYDVTYAAKHPGWQRYVGPHAEFRLFSRSGELKAIQVLAVKGSILSEAFIREVMSEFVGSPEYLISSRDKKNGILVLSGSIPNKGDIRIYKKYGTVSAFVVSRN